MSQDTTEPDEQHPDSPQREKREPGVLLRWKILAYGVFPAAMLTFIFAIGNSGIAIYNWLRYSKITMAVHMPETTGTVAIEGERTVTGLIGKLVVDVEGFTGKEVFAYVTAHSTRVIAGAAILVLALALMHRFLRREIFSQTNTTIVFWMSTSGIFYAFALKWLDKLGDKAMPLIYGIEREVSNSNFEITTFWFAALIGAAAHTAFERGQALQEKLDAKETPASEEAPVQKAESDTKEERDGNEEPEGKDGDVTNPR